MQPVWATPAVVVGAPVVWRALRCFRIIAQVQSQELKVSRVGVQDNFQTAPRQKREDKDSGSDVAGSSLKRSKTGETRCVS